MLIYAGIDEAGYGPAFGPLTVGCCVLAIPKLAADAPLPDLWKRLNKAVCRTLAERRGRLAVNDSKKLTTKAAGIGHLESGCLAFAALQGLQPPDAAAWLDAIGVDWHRSDAALPWYAATDDTPWQALPVAVDPGELAVSRGLLKTTASRIGVEVLRLACDVVPEDRFNALAAATRSKAAVSFTPVLGHLQQLYREHGREHPTAVVDRQSGRMRYRDLLATGFDRCTVSVERETPAWSHYVIRGSGFDPGDAASSGGGSRGGGGSGGGDAATLTVHFVADAERQHLPVALASMVAKYSRELLMMRFKAWFAQRLPHIAPTAGYGSDAKRFWREVRGELPGLNIDPAQLRRIL